jgi:LysR family glycine cleavage system transcriptional activator
MGGIHTANGSWRLSLPALAVFEVAARHLNFSSAARELGATQPAVSHQISWLEAELGCSLFHRLHRGVSLTREGSILFDAVSLSRDAIEQAQDEIRTLATRKLLNIATDYGFASDWLMPRLAEFSSAIADVDVRIVASQTEINPGTEAVDFTIVLGSGQWPGCVSTLLFPETVHAVASPGFLARHGPVETSAELLRLRLLHLESRDHCVWLNWNGWLAARGITTKPRHGDFFFNTYSLVQQAAIAGQGVALGWRPLIDQAIASGLLVSVLDQPVRTRMGYYLVEAGSRRDSPASARFRSWLLAECGEANPCIAHADHP